MHTDIFFQETLLDAEAKVLVAYVTRELEENKLIEKYCNNIRIFIKRYPYVLVNGNTLWRLVVYNYWEILFVYIKSSRLQNPWAKSTFEVFFNASIRIMEFGIFCAHNSKGRNVFFSNMKDKNFYKHFRSICKIVSLKEFAITKDKKNKVNILGLDYFSTLPIQPSSSKKEIDFTFYFKLENIYVQKVYLFEESKNFIDGRNSSGGKWIRTEIQTEEKYQQYLVTTDVRLDEKSALEEESFERHNKKNKITSLDVMYHSPVEGTEEITGVGDLTKVNLSTSYKRFMVSRAIGRAIAKQSLSLKSKYTIPEIEVLRVFIPTILQKKSLSSNLMLLTICFGINTSKILDVLMGLDGDITFSKKKQILKIINKKTKGIFTDFDTDISTSKSINNDSVEIYIPEVLIRVWIETIRMLNETYINQLKLYCFEEKKECDLLVKTINSKEFYKETTVAGSFKYLMWVFKEEKTINNAIKLSATNLREVCIQSIKGEFSKCINSFGKRIVLPYTTLPLLFLHLYKTRKEYSDIGLLFSGVMQKNDEARVCYGTTPKRLLVYEKWQMELMQLLQIDKILFDKYNVRLHRNTHPINTSEDWFGSKLYLNGAKFNIFLQRILSLSFEKEADHLNCRLIFLKYALSCTIAARHYKHSISVEQYSRREEILLIQEKGKNLFAGKRIIPLTEVGCSLFEKYLELKEQHNLNSFSPPLIVEKNGIIKERFMKRSEIEAWFIERKDDNNSDDIEYILKFMKNVPLNFGRHIFTSYAMSMSTLKSQYIDAYLGHYKMGLEDQGIYSHFDNQEYFQQIRNVVDEITMIYIPKEWKKLW